LADADEMTEEFASSSNLLMAAERHRREGRLGTAEALCLRALEVRPNLYEAEHLLGVIANQNGRRDEAIAHFGRAAELAPGVAILHANLSEMLRLSGRLDEATAAARRALALHPEFPEQLNNLARIASARGQSQQALDFCRQAIALRPDFADAYNTLANILKELGQLEEARRAFRRAIELYPGATGAYLNFAEVHSFVPGDPHLAAMETLAAKTAGRSKTDRLLLDFALGKAYDDLKDYRRSFQRLLAGNAAKRAQVDYDERSALAVFDNIEKVFTQELIEQKSGSGDATHVPIFVLGMPRSGTTLIEQILASHPQAHGAGELHHFFEAMLAVQGPDGRPVPATKSVSALDAKVFADIGARYLAGIRELAPAASRIVNKMPNNYYFIGFIHLALPNAKIIHVIRDPIDTCVSCFSKLFTLELNYTYDLAELGRYYRRYERLMAHWRRVLPPDRILDVRYEDVVGDLEQQARRLLDYCELPWDERCLGFYETKRQVRTASAVQVRQPIYGSSIGRWRRYRDYIAPLLAEIEPTSDEAAAGDASDD
jgi:Flp pilus assembly protein TadD